MIDPKLVERLREYADAMDFVDFEAAGPSLMRDAATALDLASKREAELVAELAEATNRSDGLARERNESYTRCGNVEKALTEYIGKAQDWEHNFTVLERAIVGETGLSAITVASELRARANAAEAEVARLTAALSAAGPRLYLDTEFNGFGGEIISMALVADDGREWYAVLPEPTTWDKWCFENVLPVIRAVEPTIYCAGREEFRQSLHAFLLQFDNPIIVADWYTDLVHFFHSFEGKDHTKSIAYRCRSELILVDDIVPDFPHNALSDARAIAAAIRSRSTGEA